MLQRVGRAVLASGLVFTLGCGGAEDGTSESAVTASPTQRPPSSASDDTILTGIDDNPTVTGIDDHPTSGTEFTFSNFGGSSDEVTLTVEVSARKVEVAGDCGPVGDGVHELTFELSPSMDISGFITVENASSNPVVSADGEIVYPWASHDGDFWTGIYTTDCSTDRENELLAPGNETTTLRYWAVDINRKEPDRWFVSFTVHHRDVDGNAFSMTAGPQLDGETCGDWPLYDIVSNLAACGGPSALRRVRHTSPDAAIFSWSADEADTAYLGPCADVSLSQAGAGLCSVPLGKRESNRVVFALGEPFSEYYIWLLLEEDDRQSWKVVDVYVPEDSYDLSDAPDWVEE